MTTEHSKSHTTPFNTSQIQTLRTHLQGQALVPGDEAYNTARLTWDEKTFDQHPALVVLPTTTADVQFAVAFAREHRLPIAVQAGGHGHPSPANDALLINFVQMRGIQINTATSTARVEAGVKAGEVVKAASAHGLAPLNGFAGTVGITGYLLNGGVGWLTRQYGSSAGSIRSAELVTADGHLLHVDEQHDPELLWGLRGGGGNFGIVTRLEFALYPVTEIFGGYVAYPIELGKAVLSSYISWLKTVPDTLTSALRIMHFPPVPALPPALRGRSAIIVMACYNGTAQEGAQWLQTVRSLGTPLQDTFAPLPYSQVATISDDPPKAPPVFSHTDSVALRDLSKNDIEVLVDIAGNPTSGIRLIEMRQLGGALAQQSEETLPFSFRAPLHLGLVAAAPTPEQLGRGKQAMTTIIQSLAPQITGEVIPSLAGNVNPEITRAALSSASYQRLTALKDRYDPQNVFRFNHNIPPTAR